MSSPGPSCPRLQAQEKKNLKNEVKEGQNVIKLYISYPKLVMDVPVRLIITQALLFH